MRKIFLFILLLSCSNIFAVTRTAVVTGSWFTPATWGGTVPQTADIAVIPAGITVTIDVGAGSGSNVPWNNSGAIKVSGKLILKGNDPFFSNPCTLEVLSGGELNDNTFNNQYLFTQVSYLKVYTGGKCTSAGLTSIIFNGNYIAEYDFPTTTMNGPFTVTVAGGQVTFSASVLPLKLIGFTVRTSGADNLLNWQTTNEINTANFFIERSSEGVYYESIGSVAAIASAIDNYYSFTDRAVLKGNSFYRLKMTDADGKFTYSDVIKLKRNAVQGISVYPSPAKNLLHIITGIKGKVALYSAEGKLVRSQQLPAGNSILDVSTLNDGIYFIEQAGQRTSFLKVSQ